MSAGIKMSGFGELERMLSDAADVLSDEDKLRDISHAALRPIADQMYARVQKRSSKTADDIRIGDEPSGDGIVRTAVGFSRGKHGRAFIATFLEYGTRYMRAFPFIRPAYDSTGGAVGLGQRAAQGVVAMLAPVLKL